MGKKRTNEEVGEIINKFGYELVTEYINGNKKNILKDIDGYFYYKSVDLIKATHIQYKILNFGVK